MKERKIILVLTALFGLAMALRAGYEEILRSQEPGSRPPVKRAAAPTPPLTDAVCVNEARAASSVAPLPGPVSGLDNNLSDVEFRGRDVTASSQNTPNVDTSEVGWALFTPPVIIRDSRTGRIARFVGPDEPSAPPPVKPEGDKPPDPAPAAPGGAPDPPAPSPPPAGPEAGKDPNVLTLLGGGRLRIKERRLEIDGVLCKRDARVNLELLACAPGGKEHESAFILKVPPREFHTALLLMGLESGEDRGGGGPQFQGDPSKPVGDRIVIEVSWNADGKTVCMAAEDLLLDVAAQAPMRRTGWTFTGSKLIDEVDVDTGRPTGKSFYVASRDRSLVTVYHDPAAILDNPMKNGGSDLTYVPREAVLPPVATAVTFVFRRATEDELKAFQKNEQEADAAWDARNPAGQEHPGDPVSPHPPDFEGPLPGPRPDSPAETDPK